MQRRKIKIGTVKFLNARPLDYGFTIDAGRSLSSVFPDIEFEVIQDVPSRIVELLLSNRIDAGLISSVEVLRNRDKLDYYEKLGVCAFKKVASIIYVKKDNIFEKPVEKIYLDRSSRSSVALWKLLYKIRFGSLPEAIFEEPRNIIKIIENSQDNIAGLVIGDPAISVYMEKRNVFIKDLAEWWFELTELPFVFAIWAFSGDKVIPVAIFEESYRLGMMHMEEIIRQSPFPEEFSESYLKHILYYRLGEKELYSLQLFYRYLREQDLI